MMYRRINGKEPITSEKAINILDNLDAAFDMLNEAFYEARLLSNTGNDTIRDELLETRLALKNAQLEYDNLKFFTKAHFNIEED